MRNRASRWCHFRVDWLARRCCRSIYLCHFQEKGILFGDSFTGNSGAGQKPFIWSILSLQDIPGWRLNSTSGMVSFSNRKSWQKRQSPFSLNRPFFPYRIMSIHNTRVRSAEGQSTSNYNIHTSNQSRLGETIENRTEVLQDQYVTTAIAGSSSRDLQRWKHRIDDRSSDETCPCGWLNCILFIAVSNVWRRTLTGVYVRSMNMDDAVAAAIGKLCQRTQCGKHQVAGNPRVLLSTDESALSTRHRGRVNLLPPEDMTGSISIYVMEGRICC